MIDVIVFSTVGILAAMTLAWILRPNLRRWIEQPKYKFLKQVIRYDDSRKIK